MVGVRLDQEGEPAVVELDLTSGDNADWLHIVARTSMDEDIKIHEILARRRQGEPKPSE